MDSASNSSQRVSSTENLLPRISVVIPAYNEQATISACLTSIACQDYPGECEVIVVDNASTDATAQIARAHGATVLTETTRGVCHARQTGTSAATGAIVVSTDADTTYPPTWLSQMHAAMADSPETVATCGPCRFEDGPWWSDPYTNVLFGLTAWVYRRTGRVMYATATNIAFRRAAWTGYNTSLTQGGDELGLLRDLRRQGEVHFDSARTTSTSARRLHRGLLYNTFVTCFFFYLLAYHVNTLIGRPLIGAAPAIRPNPNPTSSATNNRRRRKLLTAAVAVLALAWLRVPGYLL